MLMICAASAFGFYLAWERIPPQMAAWLVGLTKDPTTLLLLINLMLIVLGTAVEGTSALIIMTPIFVPILTKLGIDPVHFGVVLVTHFMAERIRAHPKFSSFLQKIAGVCLIGFGLKMVLTK